MKLGKRLRGTASPQPLKGGDGRNALQDIVLLKIWSTQLRPKGDF